MAIDPKSTALVLIEYQNDFTTEGGVLHGAVSAVMDGTGMLANTKDVVAAARAAGVTVMHAPISFAEGYNEISSHPYGILKGVVDGKAFVKGSWGAAIVDDLTPVDGGSGAELCADLPRATGQIGTQEYSSDLVSR
jgi:ureidoacrylate peracid hydrolase